MKKAISTLVVGVVLALGPAWGILGYVAGMIMAQDTLVNKTGPEKSEALASNISFSLYSALIGIGLCPIGMTLIVLSIIWIKNIKDRQTASAESCIKTEW